MFLILGCFVFFHVKSEGLIRNGQIVCPFEILNQLASQYGQLDQMKTKLANLAVLSS